MTNEIYASEYKSVVIDTVDWLEKLLASDVARRAGKDTIEDIGFGRGYQALEHEWMKFITAFNSLWNAGKNIVFVCHAKVAKFKNQAVMLTTTGVLHSTSRVASALSTGLMRSGLQGKTFSRLSRMKGSITSVQSASIVVVVFARGLRVHPMWLRTASGLRRIFHSLSLSIGSMSRRSAVPETSTELLSMEVQRLEFSNG